MSLFPVAPKAASAPTSDRAPPPASQPTPWCRSDLTRQRAGKALHYGAGLPRFVLVVAGDGWAVGSATGSGVVDLEEWAARERVALPVADDLEWLRGCADPR